VKTIVKAGLLTAALIVGVGGWWWQRNTGVALRGKIAGLQTTRNETVAENEHLHRISAGRQEEKSAEVVRSEIEKTRQEIAQSERLWQRLAKAPAATPHAQHFTENRDPEKGPVRIKDFRDVGQATPGAAFQTVIWALATENYSALVPLLRISPNGHEKLRAMVARMDAAGQKRFDPAEKIVGLLLARDFLDQDGYEIGAATEPDVTGQVKLSVLRVRSGNQNKQEKKLPLVRGPSGWQLPITDKLIDDIPRYLESLSMFVPPAKSGG
jgi:hypothetical protein